MKLPKHDLHFGEKVGSLRCTYAGGREVKFPCFNTLRDWSGSQFKLELCQFTAPVFHCRSSEIWSRQLTPVITAFLLPSSSMPTDSYSVCFYFTHFVPCSKGRKMQTQQTWFCPGPCTAASHCKERTSTHLRIGER